jgi:2-amino-4-hydroxy-6-hydroxymethyldihydropteridine diphosphokinase
VATSHTAYIGLGSNLPSPAGNPQATLAAAIQRLRALGVLSAQSSFYETEPVGITDQPRFLNAAAALQTDLPPLTLLDRLLEIERDFGRDRAQNPAKGPRTLDLDLLMLDGLVLNLPQLTLPHPAMTERRFVLAPLAEIAPMVVHPTTGKTITALLAALHDAGENRIAAVKIL